MNGEPVTEPLDYDADRQVTVYVPPEPPEAFAGDGGWHTARLSDALERATPKSRARAGLVLRSRTTRAAASDA